METGGSCKPRPFLIIGKCIRLKDFYKRKFNILQNISVPRMSPAHIATDIAIARTRYFIRVVIRPSSFVEAPFSINRMPIFAVMSR